MSRKEQIESLLKSGLSVEDISNKLGIKVKTVRNYIGEIKKTKHDESEDGFYWKRVAQKYKIKYERMLQDKEWSRYFFDQLMMNIHPLESNEENKQIYYDNTKKEEDLILLLSDFHFGECVSSYSCFVGDNYNENIVMKRLQKIECQINSVLKEMSGYNFRNIYIFLLGDFVSGMIHDELVRNSSLLVNQVLGCSRFLSCFIHNLSKIFNKVDVVGVVGNHGRLTKEVQFKNRVNNFDYMIYKIIERECLLLKNVFFDIPEKDMHVKSVRHFNFLLRHGDGNMKNGSFSLNTILNIDKNLTQIISGSMNKYIHYHVMGHFHSPMVLNKYNGKIILNGALKGVDEYAMGTLFNGSTPSQKLMSLSDDGITWIMDVPLT